MQGLHFTSGADPWILDRFKILDMREAENAAHYLSACKANAFREDPRHRSKPISLERLRPGRIGEKFGYKCITGCGFTPEREKIHVEHNPDRLDGVEQPTAVCGNRVRLAAVAVLREIAEHKIREN